MAESTASKNERLADFAADITAVSLHSADPGLSGSNEITGGAPAYARKGPVFTTPVGAAMDLSGALTFDIPGAVSISHYGLWKGAQFMLGGALSASESYAGQGTYTLTSIPITA